MMIIFLLFINSTAQEMPVPAALQGELLPKILILNKEFGNIDINIGIVFSGYLRSSVETKNEITDKILASGLDKKFNVIPIDILTNSDISHVLTENKINALYIAPIRGYNYSQISEACKDLKIVSICASPELVQKYFSVSFELVDDKPKILINQKNMEVEGAFFSSRLLKIAKILK